MSLCSGAGEPSSSWDLSGVWTPLSWGRAPGLSHREAFLCGEGGILGVGQQGPPGTDCPCAQGIFVYHGEKTTVRTGINCAHLLPTLIYSSTLPTKGANNKENCF